MHKRTRRRPVNPGALSIDGFCEAHGISRAYFFKLQRLGLGPDVMAIGRRRLISIEAAARWRRKFEASHG